MTRKNLPARTRRLLLLVPVVVVVMDALLVLASTNSSMLERYFSLLMFLNIGVVTVLAVTIAALCARLILQWRRRVFGSRMTLRLTLQVAAIAIIPCLLLFAVSSRFIGRSIDTWFNVRVEHALDSGVSLSRTAIANFQNQVVERSSLLADYLADTPREDWSKTLGALRERYRLNNVMVVNDRGDILTTEFTSPAEPVRTPPGELLALASRQGRYAAVLEDDKRTGWSAEAVRVVVIAPVKRLALSGLPPALTFPESIVKLPDFLLQQGSLRGSSFFVVAREPLPDGLEMNISAVMDGYGDYQGLVLGRESLRSLFTSSLTVSMLLAVLGTIVAVIAYAQIMTDPLRQLARGTKRVAGGNLTPIREFSGSDELNVLTQYFNDMLGQLSEAQRKVQTRTEELEQTTQYLQSVLSNLSSAVIVVDSDMQVVTANEGAGRLFGDAARTAGVPLERIAPEVHEAVAAAAVEITRPLEGAGDFHREIEIARPDSPVQMTVFVRASRLFLAGREEPGMVLVIDDMTQLISGQRAIAWGEVARRLAHEIKNPLTPIQLAAERLEMKLEGKLSEADSRLLSRSISTIVTQVAAMKQMVNDFRDYAKLPPAVLHPTDVNKLLDGVAALYREAGKPVSTLVDPSIPMVLADEAQLRQVLHNLVGNSLDAIGQKEGGRVVVSTKRSDGDAGGLNVVLRVRDNGPGFDPSVLHNSFEPYVTTKATGSGLGLPMVKKIADEHKAEVSICNLQDADGKVVGAAVSLVFRGVAGG